MAAPTLLALLAAIAFAAGPAVQQRGALETSAGAEDPRSTSAGPAAAHVHAHVGDSVVTLTGRVEAPTIAAGQVRRVRAVPGVVAVDDQLEHDERFCINGRYLA